MMTRGDEVTITSVSRAALVSRRTIYAHWGTIEDLVADSVFADHEGAERAEFLSVYKSPLELLPALVRELFAHRAR